MKVTTRPADRSTVVLEVELPADRVKRSIDLSVRHLGQRTRVPGFRPGKVPRSMLERQLGIEPIYDDAKEHLFEQTVIEALRDADLDVLAIPQPEWTSFEENTGAAYTVTVPVRPEVKLGAYVDYPFSIDIETVDDAKVDAVVTQLSEQQASLIPVEERGAQDGDYAVIGFEGSAGGVAIEGAQADRFPLVIGRERMIPGFESELVGMAVDDEKTFKVTFPDDYGETDLAGKEVEFHATMRELREKQPPVIDDEFARSLGEYADLAALREEIRQRLIRSSLDRARHTFADRIIEFATANATVDPPELLVDREVDVMVDELKVRLAEQNIGYEEYLRATEREEAVLRTEYRDQAGHRVKVLLVLGAVADRETIEVSDAAVDAEVAKGRASSEGDSKLAEYLASARGRSYIRSQLRRTQTVETLIDRWIGEHPEFSNVRHIEDQPFTDLVGDAAASTQQPEPEEATT